MLQRSSARYVVLLYIADMVLTVGALFGARWLRLTLPYGRILDVEGAALPWPIFVLLVATWTVALVSFKVYDPQRFAHIVDELQTAIVAIAVGTLAFAGLLFFSYRGLSRLLYVYFFTLDALLCIGSRVALRRVHTSRRHEHLRNVLIIGAGDVGQRVARSMEPARWLGIEVVGFLDDDPGKRGQPIGSLPVLGSLQDAQEVVREHQIQELVIALPMDAHQRLESLVATLENAPVNIKLAPDYDDMVSFRSSLEQLGEVVLVGLKEPVLGPIDRLIKRLFDVVVAVAGLVVLSPLLLGIAIAVKLNSRGSVFFNSRRIGESGHPFLMHKFRTMFEGADAHEAELVSETTDGQVLFEKREDDPRVTPVGALLRRFSLDELPQLLNVLVGEMSLVGPRPELPVLVEQYTPWQRKRFGVPQGITGWWQVSGRSNKAKYLHVEDDLYYIRNYSLVLDLRILWHTLGAVIKGEGAF